MRTIQLRLLQKHFHKFTGIFFQTYKGHMINNNFALFKFKAAVSVKKREYSSGSHFFKYMKSKRTNIYDASIRCGLM